MGTIAQELTRIQNAKASLKTSIENKGVTVPSATLIDGYPALVDQISGGGGDENKFMQSTDLKYMFYARNLSEEHNLDGLKRFSQNNIVNAVYTFYQSTISDATKKSEIYEYITKILTNTTITDGSYCFGRFTPTGSDNDLDLRNMDVINATGIFANADNISIKIKNNTFDNTTNFYNAFNGFGSNAKILIDTNVLYFRSGTNFYNAFSSSKAKFYDYNGNQITTLNVYLNENASSAINAPSVFAFNTSAGITRFDFHFTTGKVGSLNGAFATNVKSVEGLDLTSLSNSTIFGSNNTNLGKLGIKSGTTLASLPANNPLLLNKIWRVSESTVIDGQTAGYWFEDFANNLGQATKSNVGITINTTLYNSLSTAQKALITDKGYTLSSAS